MFLAAAGLAAVVSACANSQDRPTPIDSGKEPAASKASGGIDIDPALPSEEDVISVTAQTKFGGGGLGSNYHFTLHGPSGPACRDRFTVPIGMLAAGAGMTITRRWYPTNSGDPLVRDPGGAWCPGRYTGAVEFRDPGSNIDQERRLPNGVRVYGDLVGTFEFRILAS